MTPSSPNYWGKQACRGSSCSHTTQHWLSLPRGGITVSLHPSWILEAKLLCSHSTSIPACLHPRPVRSCGVPCLPRRPRSGADRAPATSASSPADTPGYSKCHVCIQELIRNRHWAWGTKCLLPNSPSCSPLPRVQLLSGGERTSFWRQGRHCQQNPFTPHKQKVSKLSASGRTPLGENSLLGEHFICSI